MRGDEEATGHLFSYVSPEKRVPADHPLRAVRRMTDEALRTLAPTLDALYATTGRPSIPPGPAITRFAEDRDRLTPKSSFSAPC